MKNRGFCKIWIAALIAALGIAVSMNPAMAEEPITIEIELFSEGGFPTGMPIAIPYGVENFDAYMIAQLEKCASYIDVSSYNLTEPEFTELYQSMINRYPEMFFVAGRYAYYANGDYVRAIVPYYYYTGTELEEMQAIYNSGINAIAAYANQASTTIGKLLRANDYLCANYEYDTDLTIFRPELMLQQKEGVCQAYMLVYRGVLNQLGITNITVASNAINHTWNMVYVDGNWYHIDVTWNDPTADMPLRARHDNFMLSDAGIQATGHVDWYDSWEAVLAAENTQYDNFFWRDLNQAAAMQGDVIYYAEPYENNTARIVYAYDLNSGTQQEAFTYNWNYTQYIEYYNPLWVMNGTAYYAIYDSLYAKSIYGGEETLVYSAGGEWLLCPFEQNGTLKIYANSGNIYTYTPQVEYTLTLDLSACTITAGESVTLQATITPTPAAGYALAWASSDLSVAAVDSNGCVTGVGAGVCEISAAFGEETASCTIVVRSQEPLRIPENTHTIGEAAFTGVSVQEIVLPEGLLTIGEGTFAENASLRLINIPASVQSIADNAFSGCGNVTLLCEAGTYGEEFAQEMKMPYVISETGN